MATRPDPYQVLQDTLRRAGAGADAAEIHGSLCGMLCCGGSALTDVWLGDSLEGTDDANAQVAAARAALRELELDTWAALNGSEMAFTPLLPDDSSAIAERVAALAEWCHGFLYGVTLSGATRPAVETGIGSEHFDEVIHDLVEISRAGITVRDDVDEADFAFAELVEFVRAGVQLIFEELAGFREQRPRSRLELH